MSVAKRIGITSIGSGVGQSVISSCRLARRPIHTIGLGTNPLAFGAYDCDEHHALPSLYADGYVDALLDRVKRSGIELIIPCLDDELPLLAAARARFEEFGCGVVVSDPALIQICRDKELMSRKMSRHTGCFVRSYGHDTIEAALTRGDVRYPLIAKPRAGFASRGIIFIHGPDDLRRIEASHVVQELAVPHSDDPFRAEFLQKFERGVLAQVSEISVQLVTNPDGDLIGRFASYNRLNNGVPIEILPFDSELLWPEIERQFDVYRRLGLRGPLNIQGRLTDEGLKFFELNARFTGITGLRSLLGFSEVEACLDCWLDHRSRPLQPLVRNPRKVGIRQTLDRTIDVDADPRIKALLDPRLVSSEAAQPRRILVTGASGHLGRNLVRHLAASPERYVVTAAGRSPDQLREILSDCPQVAICESGPQRVLDADPANFDCVVHCAFTRAQGTAAEIAASLAYTQELFDLLSRKRVRRLLHLSSRIVYDPASPRADEECPIGPPSLYAMAKYSSELMLSPFRETDPSARAVAIRLSAISGGQAGPNMSDLITKLVRRAFEQGRIDLQGGRQLIDVLNVRDAAEAIRLLIDLPNERLPQTINLGGPVIPITELATLVAAAVDRVRPGVVVQIDPDAKAVSPRALDVSRLTALTGWTATVPVATTVDETVTMLSEAESACGLLAATTR